MIGGGGGGGGLCTSTHIRTHVPVFSWARDEQACAIRASLCVCVCVCVYVCQSHYVAHEARKLVLLSLHHALVTRRGNKQDN